jgi:hypothetical protein
MSDEVIYPPRGFWVGVFGTRCDGAIGPFATEDEARAALAAASIFVTAQRAPWDQEKP